MVYQTTIYESSPILEGVNVFNGRKSYVQFHPTKEDSGLVFRVQNSEIPASIDNAFLYKSPRSLWMSHSIGVRDKKNQALCIEHLLADVYATGIDNLVIELSDGVGTRFDYDKNHVVIGLMELKSSTKEKRKTFRVKKDLSKAETTIQDKNRGDKLSVESSDGFFIDYTAEFPHLSIGKQHYKFEVSDENYVKEIIKARPIFFMPPIPEGILRRLIQPFCGVSDRNALLIGSKYEPYFRNTEHPAGIYGKEEFVRHKIMDVLGTIALLGMNFVETTFKFEKTGHNFDINALRELKNREIFERID